MVGREVGVMRIVGSDARMVKKDIISLIIYSVHNSLIRSINSIHIFILQLNLKFKNIDWHDPAGYANQLLKKACVFIY